MTTKNLIAEYLEQERNNVFAYSANYQMTQAKKGYENQFQAAKERVDLLEDLLAQMK